MLVSPLLQFRFCARIVGNDEMTDAVRGITANFAKQTASMTLVETVDVRVTPWVLRAIHQPFRIDWDMTDNTGSVLGRTILRGCRIVDHLVEQAYHTSEVTLHTVEFSFEDIHYSMIVPE